MPEKFCKLAAVHPLSRRQNGTRSAAKSKEASIYEGRKPSIELKSEGLGAAAIAKRLKIGRASVYRLLNGGQVGQQ